MEIYINNQLAALKQGTSFEYIAENRLFSGSDDYTLTITFPLAGCPRNLAIFGNIHRKDVENSKVRFDCEIRDRNFYKFGTITVTEISESEVKTQFLEGRSEQNFDDTFDDIYINELDLGKPSTLSTLGIKPIDCWNTQGSSSVEAVALPWVNNSGDGNIQNMVIFSNNAYYWGTDCSKLSWQPYLIHIAKMICKSQGYTYDFSAWEQSELRYLLCCNALPAAWDIPEYARALPHWTIAEFFEKLELLMGCEFDIDHREQHINFAFSRAVLNAIAPIEITQIVDSYSCEVTADNSDTNCDYIGAKNLVFKECDHEMWKFYSCDWLIKSFRNQNHIKEYDTLDDLISKLKWFACNEKVNFRNSDAYYIHYAKNVDTYYCVRVLRKEYEYDSDKKKKVWHYYCALQPLNMFGGHIIDDSDDADETEVEFVPAWIDETDTTYGNCIFLEPSSYDETDVDDDTSSELAQTHPVATLTAGEEDSSNAYYDLIYVAMWDGAIPRFGKMPFPALDQIEINEDWTYSIHHFSLRINHSFESATALYKYNIDPTQKFTFKFLADEIPNARALFIIGGKRYIAEKLTATFTETGMSQLIKGTFYPVV